MTVPKEVELKLGFEPGQVARLERELERDPHIDSVNRIAALESEYFDTERLDVHRAGMTLRLRDEGGRRVQTVKRDNGAGGGLFERAEWETEVDGHRLDLKAARHTGLKSLLTKDVAAALRPVFKTSVTRTIYHVDGRDWAVEVSIDQGRVTAHGREAPISELELELKRGAPRHLFALARRLRERVPLQILAEAKAQRGYELVERRPIGPVKAEKLALAKDATAEEAFRLIARSCLSQLIANEPALHNDDPEAVHQMRIAVRRLRTAMSLFADVIHDGKVGQIKSGLRWLTAQLAAARELDVFLHETAALPQVPRSARTSLDTLHAELARRRDNALAHARSTAASPQYRDLVFATLAWIESGPWVISDGQSRARRQQPAKCLARRQLDRRARKIRKRGKALAELSPRRRHKLRVQAKKVRYATDFFGALFSGKARKRRRRRFVSGLKCLQGALGQLNDVAAHETLGLRVARTRLAASRDAARHLAYAAGLVMGGDATRIAPLLNDAASAHSRFRRMKPYWH